MNALKSKTILFSILLAAFGAAQLNLPTIQDMISPESYGWISLGTAVVVAILRALTSQPLLEK